MSTHRTQLGSCPECESTIPEAFALIEYETSEGQRVFAECPGCGDVVHPEAE